MDYFDKKEISKNYHQSANASTLSKLDSLLNKPNSLSVTCKNQPDNLNSKSYAKICQLAGKADDAQLNYTYMKEAEQKEKKAEKKSGKKVPRMFKNFDNEVLSQMNKNGANVSKNISCLLCSIKTCFGLLICLGVSILVFLCLHIYKNYFTLHIGEFITICLISFCFLNGTMGFSKYSKQSQLKFDKINTLLFLQILTTGFFFTMKFTAVFAGEHMIDYCQQNFVFMIVFSAVSLLLCLLLIVFNTLVCGFYKDYSQAKVDLRLVGQQLVEIK